MGEVGSNRGGKAEALLGLKPAVPGVSEEKRYAHRLKPVPLWGQAVGNSGTGFSLCGRFIRRSLKSIWPPQRRRHECRRGTQECVRHELLLDGVGDSGQVRPGAGEVRADELGRCRRDSA